MAKTSINLLYQSKDEEGARLPNCIPPWKRNKGYFKNYGNVKYQYLEEILDYADISVNICNLDQAQRSNQDFWFHIQPEWIDLSFFYENVFHYIDEDYLRAIKLEPNVKVLLWFPTEGFHLSMPHFIDDILWTLGDKGIPEEKIYIVFGDVRFEENFKSYCKKKKIKSKVKTFGLNIFELNYWMETNRMYFSRNRMTEIDPRKELVDQSEINFEHTRGKRFVCRNANPRPHRIYVMSQIYKKKLDHMGYISFLNRYFTPGVPTNLNDFTTKEENLQTAVEDMDEFLKQTPIVLDEDAKTIGTDLNQRRMQKEHYMDSYFSIINETVCDSFPGDPLFITEKVYQPILQLHPFIVFGSRGTMEYLRDTGYKTFNGFCLVDEKYDRADKSYDRIDQAMEQVQRLCGLPLDLLHQEYIKYFDDLVYNQDHFLKLNRKEYLTEFMKWLEQPN
tara:strand:- start:13117 stop:14457 length:1341 start_codon:yes stop_codon:yes gene_type:complete